MKEQYRETLQELDRLEKLATPGELQINRCDHGGGRVYIEDGKSRTLVTDLFHLGDRELVYSFLTNRRLLIDEGLKLVEEVERLSELLGKLLKKVDLVATSNECECLSCGAGYSPKLGRQAHKPDCFYMEFYKALSQGGQS